MVFLLLNFIQFNSCDKTNTIAQDQIDCCPTSNLHSTRNYNDLISVIPKEIIRTLVVQPDEKGALGRNTNGYFHVRFQFGMTLLADYTVLFENKLAASAYLQNLNYSFSYQNTEGDFQFVPPHTLLQSPEYQPPSKANLVSATAFFAYSLGLSLHTLHQSKWYTDALNLEEIRNGIQQLEGNVQSVLTFLKANVAQLYLVDKQAPNRLLFNAITFYSLGKYLNDHEAKNIGLDFADKALAQRNKKQGYFIENGGWDSSYNGVALKLGLELFTLVNESGTRNKLGNTLRPAAHWQASRVMKTGEISTDGNTRVFPGGEKFLGKEKGIDVVKTVKAFYYMYSITGEQKYLLLTEKIISFYR